VLANSADERRLPISGMRANIERKAITSHVENRIWFPADHVIGVTPLSLAE
jgi:hypothetical protein